MVNHNSRFSKGIIGLFAIVSLALVVFSCSTSNGQSPNSTTATAQVAVPAVPKLPAPEAVAGTIEQLGNPMMDKIVAAQKAVNAGPDDVVIYYYRPDGKYNEWGYWIWAFPGGDGGTSWDYSQKLSSVEGVGYLKFKKNGSDIGTPLVGAQGTGIIARRVDGWTKDGDADRIFNTVATNEWVIFQGDQKTYPFGAYRPSIESATLTGLRSIQLVLSGRHALDPAGGANGFTVKQGDGTPLAISTMVNTAYPEDPNRNWTRRVTIQMAADVDVTKGLIVSNPSYLLPLNVNTTSLAATIAETTIPPADYRLGAIYDAGKKSVEFRLWAPLSSAVNARVFKVSQGATPDWTLPMTKDPATGVWTATFNAANPDGFFYEYEVTNGAVKNIVLDPYAKSMDVFRGRGPGRGAIIDPAKTLPAGGWEGFGDVNLAKRNDAIIYEVSVRDFTISKDAGVTQRPGSYLAFIEKLPYLKSLGITHIQLLPVLNFYYTDEANTAFEATGRSSDNNYNWGYDPHSYFTPEGWFASNPSDPYNRVVELKTLIKEAHKLGLGVLFDVVYNHTANTTILNDIVPGYYYRLTPEGAYRSNSGVGNDTASERVMMRRLISDSIAYLVEEYQVDGFRFDLMGLHDAETILQARTRAAALPNKADILFQGEGWKMYNGAPRQEMMDQNYMSKTDLVSVFNDEFRDILKGGGMDDGKKGFITDNHVSPTLIFNNLIGNPQLNYKPMAPGNNMNYIEAHDNLTARDNIANNMKLNDTIPEQRQELIARLRMGNFLVLASQGISFLHAGQESGRSKPKLNSKSEVKGDYVHNSYDSSDDINQFIWNPHPDYENLREFTRGMIGIRRSTQAFHQTTHEALARNAREIKEKNEGILALGWSIKEGNSTYYMFANGNKTETRVFETTTPLTGGMVLVDKTRASKDGLSNPTGFSISGRTITVEPLTVVMIKK